MIKVKKKRPTHLFTNVLTLTRNQKNMRGEITENQKLPRNSSIKISFVYDLKLKKKVKSEVATKEVMNAPK